MSAAKCLYDAILKAQYNDSLPILFGLYKKNVYANELFDSEDCGLELLGKFTNGQMYKAAMYLVNNGLLTIADGAHSNSTTLFWGAHRNSTMLFWVTPNNPVDIAKFIAVKRDKKGT